MATFLAKIVYQIVCGDGSHTPQFDEQLRLILSDCHDNALAKASRIGEAEAHQFINHNNCLVQWKFIGVIELYHADEYADGAEICSCIKECWQEKTYLDQVRKKYEKLSSTCKELYF